MHCAWLPLLKHFTNGINVPSAQFLGCANRAGGVHEDGEGRSQAAVESKQMALVLLSAWPSGVYFTDDFIIKQRPTSQLWHSPHIYIHLQDTRAARPSVLRWGAWEVYACVCMCLLLFGGRCSANTNVFISTPVKMSSLCLFSPHSEWHNTGPEDAIINLNVSWHFLTPLSTA